MVMVQEVERCSFGDEDLTMLDPSDFYKGMTQGIEGIIDLCEKVNYHADYPQNHNIVITNVSSSVCRLYEVEWVSHTKRDLWYRIIRRHYEWCDAFIRVYSKYIDSRTIENYERLKAKIRPGMKWIRKTFGLPMVEMALQHKKMIKKSTKDPPKIKELAKQEALAMEVEGFQVAL